MSHSVTVEVELKVSLKVNLHDYCSSVYVEPPDRGYLGLPEDASALDYAAASAAFDIEWSADDWELSGLPDGVSLDMVDVCDVQIDAVNVSAEEFSKWLKSQRGDKSEVLHDSLF